MNMILCENADFKVRSLMKDGEPWFVAKDVCGELDIANSRDAVGRLDDDERACVGITDTSSSSRLTISVNVVSESGLYALIFQSRKPEARRFRKWVTSEVLPQLRKTGSYHVGGVGADPLAASEHRRKGKYYLTLGQHENIQALEAEDVPGNVSVLAYALTVRLPGDRSTSMRVGELANRMTLVRGDRVGKVRQSAVNPRKRSLVATYPPDCVRDAYLHYGYGHEMPALPVIENRWRPLLPQYHRLNRMLPLGG